MSACARISLFRDPASPHSTGMDQAFLSIMAPRGGAIYFWVGSSVINHICHFTVLPYQLYKQYFYSVQEVNFLLLYQG